MSSPTPNSITYLGGVPLERLYSSKQETSSHPANRTRKHKKRSRLKKPSNLVARSIAENSTFKPHSGIEGLSAISAFLQDLGTNSNLSVPDSLISEVEGIAALLFTIQDCKSYVGITSAVFMHFRSYLSTSVTSQIIEYINELFEVSPQSGEETVTTEPEWLLMMRNVQTNWDLVKGNRLFGEFSKLLGLLVTFKLCSISDVTFTVKDYKLIEPDMNLVHSSALDIMDAAFATVMFFVENIYESYSQKSLMPFLCSDKTAAELEEEYAKIVLWWDLVKNGNLMKVAKVSDSEFDRRLENLCTRVKNLLGGKMNFEKKLLNDKYMKLLKIKNDYVTKKISSGVRKAPFAIELFGESSQGKTTIGDQIVDALLKSAGLPTGKDYRASYNPSDKYMSTWTTDKLVMFVDDVANDKSGFVERPPTRIIIDLCNNQPYYANMADLESKGKVFVEPAIVIANTNVKDLDAYTYSNCPYSIQRRMKFVLTVKAKAQFQFIVDGEPQGIDSDKVDAFYASKGSVPVFDDIWDLTVEKAKKPDKLEQIADYEPVKFRGNFLVNVPFRIVVQFLIEEYHKHDENQNRILERNTIRQGRLDLCPHEGCKQMKGFCDLHDHEITTNEDDEPNCDDNNECESDDEMDWSLTKSVGQPEVPISEVTVQPKTQPIRFPIPEKPFVDTFLQKARKMASPTQNPIGFTHQAGYEVGEVLYNSIEQASGIVKERALGDFSLAGSAVEGATSLALMTSARYFSYHWDWMRVLPRSWVVHPNFQRYMMILDYQKLKTSYIRRTCVMWGSAAAFITFMIINRNVLNYEQSVLYGMVTLFMCAIRQIGMVEEVSRGYRSELLKRNTLGISESIQEWRDTHGPTLYKAMGIVGVLYSLAKLYHRWARMDVQGSLEPESMKEIEQRDSEANPWTIPVKRGLPLTTQSLCIDPQTLANVVAKNLVYGTIITKAGRRLMANGLFLRSNVILLPSHYFETDELECTFRKENPEQSGGKFPCVLHKRQSILIPETDLRICYAHSGGSFKNITPWLPKANMPKHEFTMIYRKIDGNMLVCGGCGVPQKTTNGVCAFEGGEYQNLTINTYAGLCGAVLLSHGKGSTISGFHLGGKENTNKGCYGFLTTHQYTHAERLLRLIEGVVISGDGEKFEKQVLGVQVLQDKPLHPKSPLNWMPNESQIAYCGSCPGMVSSHSDVKVTKISELVTEYCGQPNIWCSPKMRPEWFGWQKCLASMALPANPFSFDILEVAIVDYKSGFDEIFKRDYIKSISPLTDHDNLCGRMGVKFIDSINLSTSIGFPLTGAKRKYVNELEPTEEYPNNRELDPVIMTEIRRCESCYERGERAYTIAKACKKDEVVDKEKCRIYFGNPIALTFLIRKYFLPIIRILQLFPLKSECAVGINSHGPEWQQFHEHVHKFGSDRMLGGDYGKYDQKLPSQLLFASLRILIDFARMCDYQEEELLIMEAMTGDIVYALIAFNGDLISLTEGSHISGNSLTVILNGICGSLNLRCAFYSLYMPETIQTRIKFRDVVALMTYGDDNIGSVSDKIDGFNIKSISQFLEAYGQTYTMPDKESELVPFLESDGFEFLKRTSVYCPQKGQFVGALVEKSIFKMLHCYLYSKKCEYTEEWACAQNIDTALREWENHGSEVYELRRSQMVDICSRNDRVRVLCTRLEVPYDQCVDEWRQKYDPSYVPFSEPDVPDLVD